MKQIPLVLLIVLGLSLCNLTDKLKKSSNTDSNASPSGGSSTSGEAYVKPTPSAAEAAALEGGKPATWDEQGLAWKMPPKWTEQSKDRLSFSWGGGGSAFMNLSISPMDDSFPVDASMKAYYQSAQERLKRGEIDQLKYMELDGVKGIEWRESDTDKPDDIRRLQWMAYRKHHGVTQMLNLILSTTGANFAKRQDELYGILYSTKIEQ
jgi:hypothetical protein